MIELIQNFTPEVFSITGYISLGMGILVPIFWLLHWLKKPKRWFVHIALFISITAFILAKYNSLYYVNMIEEDRSEQMAEKAKAEKERLRKLQEMRSDDVANIRFAEDGATDALDVGGMDKTDLRLYNLDKKFKTPKKGDPLIGRKKKKRTFSKDNTLEGTVDTSKPQEGADTEDIEEEAKPPVVLKADQLAVADNLDILNLSILRWFIILSILYLVIDYLRRGNNYDEAYCPLPVPSECFKGVSNFNPVITLPPKRRRKMIDELDFYTHRNEPFIYLANDKETIKALPEKGHRLLKKFFPVEYLPVTMDGKEIDADYIFETLWYNRSSFYCDSLERAEELLIRFIELMGGRKESRAEASQIVRIVWDMDEPVSDDIIKLFELLGKTTGVSLVICK